MPMDPNYGLMIATFVYAGATGVLAGVTAWGVRTSDRASRANNQTNIEAAAAALTRQIESTQAITARQIEAAVEAGRQQALLSAVSLNRQGWINQLRDEIAGFVAENALRRGIGDRITDVTRQLQEQVRIHAAKERHFRKVELLINMREEPSRKLLELMHDGLHRTLSLEAEKRIVAKAQEILKTEWDRVRSGT